MIANEMSDNSYQVFLDQTTFEYSSSPNSTSTHSIINSCPLSIINMEMAEFKDSKMPFEDKVRLLLQHYDNAPGWGRYLDCKDR